MRYNGKYSVFDSGKINTYHLATRTNKVTLEDLALPAGAHIIAHDFSQYQKLLKAI